MTRRIQFAGLLLALALTLPAFAQRGSGGQRGSGPQSLAPPASLTTGGTHLPTASPSILSPGFGRVDNGTRFNNGGRHSGPPRGGPHKGFEPQRDHRGHNNRFAYPVYPGSYYPYYGYSYGYGLPVYVEDYSSLPGGGTFDNGQTPADNDDREAPTVFENRRPSEMYRPNAGENSVIEDRERYGDHYTDRRESEPTEPAPEARGVVTTNGNENNDTTTVLVFKDGVQREVKNYAIMGQYIFVFAGDHRKIPLAELDLDATKKLNEDRGNEFKVPSSSDPT